MQDNRYYEDAFSIKKETYSSGVASSVIGGYTAAEASRQPRLVAAMGKLEDTRMFVGELAQRVENLADRICGCTPVNVNTAEGKNLPSAPSSHLDVIEDHREAIQGKLHCLHAALQRLEDDLG